MRVQPALTLIEIRHAERKPDVKDQDHVAALEVRLRVEVRRVGDHPPPALGAVQKTSQMSWRTGPTISDAALSAWMTASPPPAST